MMKGLLLKDFYFTRLALIFSIIATVCFSLASYYHETNSYFFIFYPVVLSGIIIFSTFAYEEKFKLSLFTEALPCSRTKVVNAKYILVLIYTGISTVITASVQVAKLLQGKNCLSSDVLSTVSLLVLMALLPQALSIPLLIKFNATKAQYIVYFIIGAVMGFTGFINGFTEGMSDGQAVNIPPYISLIFISIAIIIFALSWFISIRIYNKRDLA